MNRCPYCGHRCHGRTCQYCVDLHKIEAAMLPRNVYGDDPLNTWTEGVRNAARRREAASTRKGKGS